MGQKGKGQGHNALLTENNFFPIKLTIMKLHRITHIPPMRWGCALLILGFKGHIRLQWLFKMIYGAYLLSLYTDKQETSYTNFPWVKDVPYRCQGQRSMSQLITEYFLVAELLSLYTYNHETLTLQGCALLILGSKDQRSRSQCINNWKWVLVHNCFHFTPIIMKLHPWVQDMP